MKAKQQKASSENQRYFNFMKEAIRNMELAQSLFISRERQNKKGIFYVLKTILNGKRIKLKDIKWHLNEVAINLKLAHQYDNSV